MSKMPKLFQEKKIKLCSRDQFLEKVFISGKLITSIMASLNGINLVLPKASIRLNIPYSEYVHNQKDPFQIMIMILYLNYMLYYL